MEQKELLEIIKQKYPDGTIIEILETNCLKDGTEVYIYKVPSVPGKFFIYMYKSENPFKKCPNIFAEKRYNPKRIWFDLDFDEKLISNWIGSIMMKNLIEIAVKENVEQLEGDFDCRGCKEDIERRKEFYTKLLFEYEKNKWILTSDKFKESLERCCTHGKND